ncbi:MAG: sigma-54-dependent Fis family transcriptional regulator [Planctomycetes bacterium]|nr:sigma-54-dependent Fis family transcriptional regulator [Planctomycetota bacterium]
MGNASNRPGAVRRIGVVDDNEIMRDSLVATLEAAGHDVVGFASAEAILAAAGDRLDLLISDLKMPGMDGIALLQRLRQAGVETPVILMTAYGTIDTAVKAMRFGAYDYITKPFDGDKILTLVDRALAHGQLQRENEVLRAELSETLKPARLIGVSAACDEVTKRITLVANSQATVLIQGESGTGKEVIARTIHAASHRRDKPMLAVNCAALSKGLLESELFGHEAGSFTGADKLRRGRFELADGGTLLLDEISEMDLALQAKLLRVLQEKTFERVGSSISRSVDVRVIVTTNRDLKQWVAEGKFRADLYYRLNVVPILVPPLRHRPQDIEPLAEYFNQQVACREGRPPKRLTPAALEALRRYRWPGNVRELQNIIERANVLTEQGLIDDDLIAPWLDGAAAETDQGADGNLLAEMERNLILSTLKRFDGHRARTSSALGIGVRTLGLKLKRYREEGVLIEA